MNSSTHSSRFLNGTKHAVLNVCPQAKKNLGPSTFKWSQVEKLEQRFKKQL